MKRNQNLETLSWEHHDGLVVAFRLQQGVKKGIDSKILSNYILNIWEHALQHHFWQEEEIIGSNLKENSEGKKMLSQMLEEHHKITNLIKELKQNKDDYSNILKFAEMLNKHIRFEERKLFPLVENLVPKNELAGIGTFLHENHQSGNKDWEPRFWQE